MTWRVLLPGGEAVYCATVSRPPAAPWFELADIREERQLTRGARAASYAGRVGTWYATDLLAREEPEPGWWGRTVADAQAELDRP